LHIQQKENIPPIYILRINRIIARILPPIPPAIALPKWIYAGEATKLSGVFAESVVSEI